MYKTQYCVQAWSPNLDKDRVSRTNPKNSHKVCQGTQENKVGYEDRLKQLGIYSLEKRRLRGDLIGSYKMRSYIVLINYSTSTSTITDRERPKVLLYKSVVVTLLFACCLVANLPV